MKEVKLTIGGTLVEGFSDDKPISIKRKLPKTYTIELTPKDPDKFEKVMGELISDTKPKQEVPTTCTRCAYSATRANYTILAQEYDYGSVTTYYSCPQCHMGFEVKSDVGR